MQRKMVLLSLFLLATLVLSTMPVQGLRSNLLTTEQNDAAEAIGSNAPYGEWERVFDVTTFYFDTSDVLDANAGFYDYEFGDNLRSVEIDNTPAGSQNGLPTLARFDLPLDILPEHDMRVYRMEIVMRASCDSAGATTGESNTVPLGIEIDELRFDGTNWNEVDQNTNTGDHDEMVDTRLQGTFLPGAAGVSTGTYTYERGQAGSENGFHLSAATERIRFTFDLQNPLDSCTLLINGDASTSNGVQSSYVRIFSDSPRLNGWVEDKNGNPTDALPSAATTAPQNRIVQVNTLQATGFQRSATFVDEGTATNYLPSIFGGQYNIRLRDLDTSDIVYDDDINALSDGSLLKPVGAPSYTAIGDAISHNELTFQYSGSLDDSRYRFEIYGEGFSYDLQPFSIGLRSMEVSVIGAAEREINPDELTFYRLQIKNNGIDQDQYTATVTSATSGWGADLVARSTPLIAGGETAELSLVVEPPKGAAVGAEGQFTIRTRSSFPNEVAPVDTPLKVTLVVGGTSKASLSGAPTVQEMFPGSSVDIPNLRLNNEAPFTENYVFRTIFPNDVTGWNARVDPLGAQVPAASSSDFVVSVTAPTTARDGDRVSLTVQALPVGSTGTGTSMVIPIEIAYVPGLELAGVSVAPLDGSTVTQQIRNDGSQSELSCLGVCLFETDTVSDTTDERTATFRVEISNPTPLEETYDLRGGWRANGNFAGGSVQGVAVSDSNADSACADSNEQRGWPDGWRFAVGEAGDITNNPSTKGRTMAATTVTVPAQTTVYRYVSLGWVEVGANAGSCTESGAGLFDLTFQSRTDRSLSKSISVGAHRIAAGGPVAEPLEFANSHHRVFIEPERVDGEDRFAATELGAIRTDGSYGKVSYPIRVGSLGNEHQEITITVDAPVNGWSQKLVWRNTVPDAQPDCVQVNDRRIRCSDLGAGDEAGITLEVTPGDGIPLHRTATHQVTVSTKLQGSEDANEVASDTLFLVTKTIGQFNFDAQLLKGARQAPAGSTVSLPFVVQNTGSNGDDFTTILTAGDSTWNPRFTGDTGFFLPGQSEQTGFVLVTIPENTAVGVEKVFRVQVENGADTGVKVLDFKVKVIADSGLKVTAKDALGRSVNSVLLPDRGSQNTITLRAVAAGDSAGSSVTFNVDEDALPPGWTLANGDNGKAATLTADSALGSVAEVTVRVTPPLKALATNKVPLLVTATTNEATPRSAGGDIVMTLTQEVGVAIEVLSEQPLPILAGGEATHQILVQNLGLGQDTFQLTHTALPDEWNVFLSTSSSGDGDEVVLGPLENRTLDVVVLAPGSAPARDNVAFNVRATSALDAAVFDFATLTTVVGFNDMEVTAVRPIIELRPQETANIILNVKNIGTLPDDVAVNASIATTSLANEGVLRLTAGEFELRLNETKQYRLAYTLGDLPPSDVDIVANVTFTSLRNTQVDAVEVSVPIVLRVLPYEARDIDGDRLSEYAVDADGSAANGFEAYRESNTPGGRNAQPADLVGLMTPAARASFNVTVADDDGNTTTAFNFILDGDEDGRWDHMLDDTGDGLPNIYWDPDTNHSTRLTIAKDISADGVADYFVDLDGDGTLDRVYNVRTGKWLDLIAARGANGAINYVVDLNNNGRADANEPVLVVASGRVVSVTLQADIDGDGQLDTVVDEDGDGCPDFFIRAGTNDAIAIQCRDVNGDGVDDWVYDENLDGQTDSYYNPATQQGGQRINAAESFASVAKDFWYVPVLFVLVVILFIVLVAVTRR